MRTIDKYPILRYTKRVQKSNKWSKKGGMRPTTIPKKDKEDRKGFVRIPSLIPNKTGKGKSLG